MKRKEIGKKIRSLKERGNLFAWLEAERKIHRLGPRIRLYTPQCQSSSQWQCMSEALVPVPDPIPAFVPGPFIGDELTMMAVDVAVQSEREVDVADAKLKNNIIEIPHDRIAIMIEK